MKLIPRTKYRVRGMEMYFWYSDGDLLTFYYYAIGYHGKNEILYYRNYDLKKSDIVPIKEALI